MSSGLFDLAIIFLLAAALSLAARLLKQPLILAYLATGVVGAVFGLITFSAEGTLQIFSSLGVMFLLFLIGLEINYSTIRSVGRVSLILGLAQIAFTSLIGFGIARLFQFPIVPSLYIAVALTFSSTIIILKLLSEKRDENSLYGRISIGFLLVQDFVAIIILVFLTGLQGEGSFSFLQIFFTLIQGAVLFGAMLFLGQRILPSVFHRASHSQELLFLVALAWVFLMVSIVERLGFSIEMGGFLAGLALANSSEHFQIAARVKPLRDFFILVFFVILGFSLASSGVGQVGFPVIVFSLFVLFGNPLIVLIIMGIMGYRKRTSFLTGLTVAQISEFSLVLVALGARLGHLSPEVVALVTAVGVITITVSTYFIIYSDTLYRYLSSLLSIFERKKVAERDSPDPGAKSILLIGCHRTGQSIALHLPKKDLLIVDFDPEVVRELERRGFSHVFGDIADPDIASRIPLESMKIVISTSPSMEDNLLVLSLFSGISAKARPRIILRAEDDEGARALYRRGADYVLFPNFTAGQYLGKTIAIDPEMRILAQLRETDQLLMRKVASKF